MSKVFMIDLESAPIKGQYFSKKIAWPVYAWKAILPKTLTDEIDILQRLILSLAQINKLKGSSILNDLGISKELLESVKESCKKSGYLNKDSNLTPSGEQILSDFVSIEKSMISHYEQIYIFRDALTGDIIPNFTIKELPSAYLTPCEYIFKDNKNYKMKKPSFTEIEAALRINKKNKILAENIQKEYGIEEVLTESMVDADLMEFLEEVDWREINEDSTAVESNENEQINVINDIPNVNGSIKIMDDKPNFLYLSATLFVDADLPQRFQLTSPMGGNEGYWFGKHLLIQSKKNEEVSTLLDIFNEEAHEYLKHRYPFNNNLNIELFNKYPIIANDSSWGSLREEIEAMQKSFSRIENGDEDFDTFYMRAQRTLECTLKMTLDTIPNKKNALKLVNIFNFKDTIMRIQEELQIVIPRNLHSNEFYDRLYAVINKKSKSNSSKDRALFLAFDAYFNPENRSVEIFRDIPDFYERINRIVNLRNQSTHYTENKSIELFDYKVIKAEVDRLLEVFIAKYLLSRGE